MTHAEMLEKRCGSNLGAAMLELETAMEKFERATFEVEAAIAYHAEVKAELDRMQANSIKARRDAWANSRKSGK